MTFGTFIVLLVLAAVVVMTVRRLARDKKAGRSSCGCGCSHCAMADKCHTVSDKGGR
ncbi:MAG: FeoB-associated Cys-rich membrane protein [Firmicutes bacterium]|nr:FeoB-associated Cys-rich membrane protein [Bacillota bacterium]MBR3392124.1 FeoB-associated Cys-rich membrane protein [Bacillota bacterium]